MRMLLHTISYMGLIQKFYQKDLKPNSSHRNISVIGYSRLLNTRYTRDDQCIRNRIQKVMDVLSAVRQQGKIFPVNCRGFQHHLTKCVSVNIDYFP